MSNRNLSSRKNIMLECFNCMQQVHNLGRSRYFTTKNIITTVEKLQLLKFCKFCKKHTLHNETK